ncbi:hypothetical protein [Pandoraea sp. NPDC090278]|uniref:hypothetical protein n=1 Tax=Pandoraea sp. NPDC090278 TaxID=3364391 RepID=UPI00383AE344
MPLTTDVNTSDATYVAQLASRQVEPEPGPQDNPAMAGDLCRVSHCACHAMLFPDTEKRDIQILVTARSAGIQRLAISLKTNPDVTDPSESGKTIDETKESEESGKAKDSYEAIQTAKNEMQKAVYDRHHSSERTTVPRSFSKLSEDGKRTVFAATVHYVLSNSSEITPIWFADILDFAADGGLIGYFHHAVSQTTYDKLNDLAENRLAKSVIKAFGMLRIE